MSRIWSMMDIGKRSLMNNQDALQTVSHNIANKSTEGYSRQRVDFETAVPTGMGRRRMGNGAWSEGATRTNNSFIEKQLAGEQNKLGTAEASAGSMGQLEQVFNEQQNKGLNKFVGEFFNSFRELSNSPESVAIRSMVKESADFLARDFKRVHSQLGKIQEGADFQVGVHIQDINEMTTEIADLNGKIQGVEMHAREANDERDRRDLLIKKLGAIINIKYAEGRSGAVTITAGNNAILVSGGSTRELIAARAPAQPGKKEGRVDVFYKSINTATPLNMTDQIKTGKLGGLLQSRDGAVGGILDQMDELAYELVSRVNEAHRQGYDAGNRKGGAFFKDLAGKAGAAGLLEVSEDIQFDPGRIAAGASPDSPGDNRVANIISSMQYERNMNDDQNTFDDFYNNVVGSIGVKTARVNSELGAQKDIVDQLEKIRESISGVSLDEETAKMIEYQKSYDASARLIRTVDEMMQTVLNLKPM